MQIKKLILFIILPFTCSLLYAQDTHGDGINFIVNKGQWQDPIRYKAEIPGGALFIIDSGFVYNFRNQEDIDHIHDAMMHDSLGKRINSAAIGKEAIRYHAYTVYFKDAAKPAAYIPEGKKDYFHNYFLGDHADNWASNVALYGKVTLKNIYNGIDVVLYSHEGHLKYDLEIAPGADPQNIRLCFNGVIPELNKDGSLVLRTTVNEIKELPPYTYQVIDGKKITIPCRYALDRNVVGFELPEGYDSNYPLIIDPTLIFSTNSGSSGQHKYAGATTYDESGNLYAGATATPVGWPVTTGAYQQTAAGGFSDIGINKYNATGTALLYSTYFGGNGREDMQSMIVNENGELVITGTTQSTDLPTTPGCYDSAYSGNGVNDIFVAVIGNNGSTLSASTYIGGNSHSFPRELKLDSAGNIWIAGFTYSSDFPVTSNALQNSYGGGGADGVLLHLSHDCTKLLYSTFYGGSGYDQCLYLILNKEQNIVFCGSTGSNDLPVTNTTLHPTPLGGGDGFVGIINAQNGSLAQGTYLGTTAEDEANMLELDEQNNIFALGITKGNYPISDNVYSIPSGDHFIDKLTPDLSTSLLSTRIGNNQNSSAYAPRAFLYDICGHLYIAGFNATGSLPVTPDAYQDSARSFWFCVLKPEFKGLLYASYFGSKDRDHDHGGIHRFDKNGIIYQSICSDTRNFPITPGAVFPEKKNTGVDMLSFKFDFNLAGVRAGFKLPPGVGDSLCAPYDLAFTNTTLSATYYRWDFGDGSPLSNEIHPVHKFEVPGVYIVTLYAYNDTACKASDTFFKTITVMVLHQPYLSIQDTIVCKHKQLLDISVSIPHQGPYTNIYWEPLNGIVGPNNKATISVNPALSKTFYVTVRDSLPGYCSVLIRDTLNIINRFVDYLPQVQVATSCRGDRNGRAYINTDAKDTTQYHFVWRSDADTSILSITDSLLNVPSGNYQITIFTAEGCDTTLFFFLPMEDHKVSFIMSDTVLCQNDTLHFKNTSGVHFSDWTWQLGIDSAWSNDRDAVFQFNQPGVFKITLIGEGSVCTDTAYQYVTVDSPVNDVFFLADKSSVCVGESINFAPYTDSSTVKLFWEFGDGSAYYTTMSGPVMHSYEQSGLTPVTLNAYFRACPLLTFKDTLKVHPLPKVKLSEDKKLCLHGTPIYLSNIAEQQSSGFRYLWNTGDTLPTLTVTAPGLYTLTVTSETTHCTGSENVLVEKGCYLDIPNAFSPNGDGINDYFLPRQMLSDGIVFFKMEIFNRWGQRVFITENNEGRGWDGKVNGQEQPIGVYVYMIEVIYNNGKVESYKGNVSLLR